jgi:hypothetical protein
MALLQENLLSFLREKKWSIKNFKTNSISQMKILIIEDEPEMLGDTIFMISLKTGWHLNRNSRSG